MPFVDTRGLKIIERLPGWYGRYFHSANMTFAHYDFKRGSSIHEHFHPQEEVYEVIEGELEVTIDGVSQIARPGLVAIVPGNVPHSVRALTEYLNSGTVSSSPRMVIILRRLAPTPPAEIGSQAFAIPLRIPGVTRGVCCYVADDNCRHFLLPELYSHQSFVQTEALPRRSRQAIACRTSPKPLKNLRLNGPDRGELRFASSRRPR